MIPVVLGLGSNNDFNGLKPLELLAQGCQKLQNFFYNHTLSSGKNYRADSSADLSCSQEMSQHKEAQQDIKSFEQIKISSIYRTQAMYVTDQNDFFNMAVFGYVCDDFSPFSLLEEIHKIEAECGRNRSKEIRFGPRSLDIDIELFGNQSIQTPDLQVPHPRLKERSFILTPMLEILPVSADCIDREMFADCLRQLPDQGVRLFMNSLEFRQSYLRFNTSLK